MRKVYVVNYNGILSDVMIHYARTGQLTDNYHEASVFLTWQDVRGELNEVAKIMQRLGKTVIVYQHGRGATRDYGPPNSFPLTADKIMVWGETERLRLLRYGIPDERIVVVGCTLLSALRPRTKRDGINILLAPVISMKEEPENVMVYAKLKEWESQKLFGFLTDNYAKLKTGWAQQINHMKVYEKPDGTPEHRLFRQEYIPTIPRNVTYSRGLVNTKLTGIHDMHQYMTPLIVTNQAQPNHIETTAELLSNTDAMVCLEEGTMQLLACALDIPVILVDIFKYGTYGGVQDYDRVEKIATEAVYRIADVGALGRTLDHALAHPAERRKHRIATVEAEGAPQLGNASEQIVKVVNSYLESGRVTS